MSPSLTYRALKHPHSDPFIHLSTTKQHNWLRHGSSSGPVCTYRRGIRRLVEERVGRDRIPREDIENGINMVSVLVAVSIDEKKIHNFFMFD